MTLDSKIIDQAPTEGAWSLISPTHQVPLEITLSKHCPRAILLFASIASVQRFMYVIEAIPLYEIGAAAPITKVGFFSQSQLASLQAEGVMLLDGDKEDVAL